MEILALLIFLIWGLGLFEMSSIFAQEKSASLTEKCSLQGTARSPAFSVDGDYIIGGAFSIHNNMYTVKNNYTTAPKPPRCSGRLVFERWILKLN